MLYAFAIQISGRYPITFIFAEIPQLYFKDEAESINITLLLAQISRDWIVTDQSCLLSILFGSLVNLVQLKSLILINSATNQIAFVAFAC